MNWRPGGAQGEKAILPPKDWTPIYVYYGSGELYERSYGADWKPTKWWYLTQWWIPVSEVLATLPGGEA